MENYEADSPADCTPDSCPPPGGDTATARKRPSSQQIASRRKAIHDQKIAVIAGCSVLAVALIVVVICLLVNAGKADDGKICANVYAAGIDLGGMTRDEARGALRLAANKTLTAKDMVVILPDGVLRLSPEDTKPTLDVDAVVDAAYRYGRTGSEKEQRALRAQAKDRVHTIALLPYLQDLDLQYIRSSIEEFCSSHGTEEIPTTVTLTGTRPTYDPEHPTLPVTHQTMTIVTGTPDYDLNVEDLYAQVLDAFSLNILEVNYQIDAGEYGDLKDAEAIFNQYCIQPQDAVQDALTYEITPEVYGYGFDVEEVQHLLDLSDYGDTIELELEFLFPGVISTDLDDEVFTDTLCTYTTTGSGSDNRAHNLKLSCQTLNNYVIAPGAVFSLNEALGRPGTKQGYKLAPGYQNGALTDIVGGGIDQTASTLYYCALLADLDILERSNNAYKVDYIDLGLDASIEWGITDLKFVNNTGSPIRIVASAEGQSVTINLLGVDDRNYDVTIVTEILEEYDFQTVYQEMVWNNIYGYTNGKVLIEGIPGYLVQTSVEKRHRQSGLLMSTTLIDTSTYTKRNEKKVYIASITDMWS